MMLVNLFLLFEISVTCLVCSSFLSPPNVTWLGHICSCSGKKGNVLFYVGLTIHLADVIILMY